MEEWTATKQLKKTNCKQEIAEQLEDVAKDLVKGVLVIPYYKAYKPDGIFWIASSRPMSYQQAKGWLKESVETRDTTSISWVGPPKVGMVKSRGVLDYFFTNPGLPRNVVFD